ncbi:allophanate hydrolase [Gordonia amarae]|uniref:Allophanate hydrolase n=2 Tax=Gordonia amarae TaxID=36821 RepID=A0A857KGT9_9ACTN|nr:allophanate hydrolase [Gordonia amarae]MCS3877674.1 allophanate hydrolase [Gordonia amarae]QHN16383.1 allophanate hydrolase [Gordonia amarae]QHN20952.1 allophanate hydrolase [Gordonia amarae]QHN29803.1 allophanate hydrolase [Gordonia amarae]QHN38578.1 allophanate hydrolase [Gordonia amarae]
MSRIAEIYRAIAAAERPEVFISLREALDVERDYRASVAANGPLAGIIVAVKDNVDVAGLPTTAACPGFAYPPTADAPVVAALRAAGAVVIGKTNLDQFATGLVGTRSPYGAVRDSRRPDRISGGSSSGSAVAVALGFADIAIGTDTAGSGRIPAGLQGIVGIKPTLGVVSTRGVVPACASYDAVTVFAADVDLADRAMAVMATAHGPRAFGGTAGRIPLAAPEQPVVAIPAELPELDDAWRAAFADAVTRAQACGMSVKAVDLSAFLAAATLLYGDALVAERSEAVGDFLAGVDEGGAGDDRAGVDPTVAGIVSAAARFSAVDLLRAHRKLDGLRTEATAQLDGIDALLVPTAPFHPTIDEVAADPVGVNSRMGTYTNFCNLFDLCAVAVPAGTVDEHDGSTAQFGVTFLGRTHHDALITDLARRFAGMPEQQRAWPERAGAPAVELAVFGAHMRTGPLTHELSSRGARWVGQVRTAPWYRLVALETAPPKPGLIREPGEGRGIRGEIWHLPPDALGEFLAALPYPMTLGKVELDDGRWVVGFGCAADAGESATPLDTDRWPLPTSPR